MTAAPFDHPYLSGLLGDAEIAALLSASAELREMLRFEAELAKAQSAEGVIPRKSADRIVAVLAGFSPDLDKLKDGAAQDGVVVPELVKQLRKAIGGSEAAHVHFGATSQDVVDTSLALRLRDACAIFERRIDALVAELTSLKHRDGETQVMAHTRMQAAIPVAAARKIRSWRDPLARHRERLPAIRDGVAVLHFAGAAGTLEKLGDKGPAVARRLADALRLKAIEHPRHSERDGIAELASWLSLVTGSLGKMGQDIALAAQSEIGEIRLASGGGSSAMPHKVNPVGAETLVALARFNATLLSGMHQSLVHENERSGAAWTLEWMLLPQMTIACGAALLTAAKLVEDISFTARDAGA